MPRVYLRKMLKPIREGPPLVHRGCGSRVTQRSGPASETRSKFLDRNAAYGHIRCNDGFRPRLRALSGFYRVEVRVLSGAFLA
jgi:hypothetical protein